MIPSIVSEAARYLRVADADIKDIEQVADHEFIVTLNDGGRAYATYFSVYRLNDYPSVKGFSLMLTPKSEAVLIKEQWAEVELPDDPGEPEIDDRLEAEKTQLVVPIGTNTEVIKWVGQDKERANAALEKERARAKPRLVLIKQLEKVLEGGR